MRTHQKKEPVACNDRPSQQPIETDRLTLPKHRPANETAPAMVPVYVDPKHLTIVAAPPDFITQRNCEQQIGAKACTFLRELLPKFRADGFQITSHGKLRLVDREVFVAWLKRTGNGVHAKPKKTEPSPVSGADSVLAELGLQRAGGRS